MDAFSLVARLTLDSNDYDDKLGESKGRLAQFGEMAKKGLGVAAKAAGAALAAGSTAVVSLTKNAVAAYADYEQLVGGVETLFGDSADVVQKYAEEAYKTAGMSANEYMETVTGFSASLLQSLDGDTAEAARISDMAIRDMSDNANKMGTSMESITTAYAGFAKQNYTMLDNLKLGYGGTKSEMERLLADAEKFSGVHYDIDNLNDVYEAIHAVQENMGITGTTAAEASKTISGSTAAMKSAWQNLVTGIADENADFETLIDNFIESAETAANNLIPRIEVALRGIGKLVQRMAPVIADALPTLVQDVLPPILVAAGDLVNALVESLPAIADALIQAAPGIITMLITTLATMAPEFISLAGDLIVALVDGITAALPVLMEKAPEILWAIITTLIDHAGDLLMATAEMLAALLRGIGEWIRPIAEKIRNIGQTIKDGFMSFIEKARNWGRDLIDNFVGGIKAKISAVTDAVSNVAGKVKNFLGFSEPDEGPLSNFHTYAPDMMKLFADGIKKNTNLVTDQIGKSFDFGDMYTAPAVGGANNNISITVQPAPGMDEERLADLVMERMQTAVNRRAAVFA